MSYIMDTIFGDGSPGSGTPDPLKTVGSFFNASIALVSMNAILNIGQSAGEVISNGVSGGVGTPSAGVQAPAAVASVSFTGPSA